MAGLADETGHWSLPLGGHRQRRQPQFRSHMVVQGRNRRPASPRIRCGRISRSTQPRSPAAYPASDAAWGHDAQLNRNLGPRLVFVKSANMADVRRPGDQTMLVADLALDDGVASCSKDGQYLDVGVGQPTIRIDAMMVGGAS